MVDISFYWGHFCALLPSDTLSHWLPLTQPLNSSLFAFKPLRHSSCCFYLILYFIVLFPNGPSFVPVLYAVFSPLLLVSWTGWSSISAISPFPAHFTPRFSTHDLPPTAAFLCLVLYPTTSPSNTTAPLWCLCACVCGKLFFLLTDSEGPLLYRQEDTIWQT